MITLGLTTWSEHGSLLQVDRALTLAEYASFFPVVEIDTFYYGIRRGLTKKWLTQVPPQFQFIVKASQAMTQQQDFREVALSQENLFQQFVAAIKPLIERKQLKAILLQFPPYFQLNSENLHYLQQVRSWLPDLPVAIEFRSSSWYATANRSQTLAFLETLQFIHVIADEPQTPANSVPAVYQATNSQLTILRLHGRNFTGWANSSAQWRHERTNYHYSTTELQQLAENVQLLSQQSHEICVIFNNNGHGDAAVNAQELQAILGLEFEGLGPQQLNLF